MSYAACLRYVLILAIGFGWTTINSSKQIKMDDMNLLFKVLLIIMLLFISRIDYDTNNLSLLKEYLKSKLIYVEFNSEKHADKTGNLLK